MHVKMNYFMCRFFESLSNNLFLFMIFILETNRSSNSLPSPKTCSLLCNKKKLLKCEEMRA